MSETPENFFRMKMRTTFKASKNKDNKEGQTEQEKEKEKEGEGETHKEENKIIKTKNQKRAVKKTKLDKIDDITNKT
jgi:hypothetical protein